MTAAQKVQIAMSKIRDRLREIGGIETLTDEIRTEAEKLTADMGDLEVRHRALILAEPAETVTEGAGDGEAVELRAIRKKVRVSRYVFGAADTRRLSGAEAEFNAALQLPEGAFPLALLAPETRAVTATNAGATQGEWTDRLFSGTAAAAMGVSFPAAGPGRQAYPVTTAGGSPSQRDPAEAAGDAVWTVGVVEAKPKGSRVRAVFTVEDAARLGDLDGALERDLRNAMTERIDRAVFVGDSGAATAANDIVGLTTATDVTEVVISQANKTKGAGVLAAFAGMVDGKNARSMADLRTVLSVGANTLWASSLANSGGSSDRMIAEAMRDSGISWVTRGDIETATASGDFGGFIGRNGGGLPAVAPTWDQGTLIRDIYSGAASGEVSITLNYMWDFVTPRPAQIVRIKFA